MTDSKTPPEFGEYEDADEKLAAELLRAWVDRSLAEPLEAPPYLANRILARLPEYVPFGTWSWFRSLGWSALLPIAAVASGSLYGLRHFAPPAWNQIFGPSETAARKWIARISHKDPNPSPLSGPHGSPAPSPLVSSVASPTPASSPSKLVPQKTEPQKKISANSASEKEIALVSNKKPDPSVSPGKSETATGASRNFNPDDHGELPKPDSPKVELIAGTQKIRIFLGSK